MENYNHKHFDIIENIVHCKYIPHTEYIIY